jgi:hypothetical protein
VARLARDRLDRLDDDLADGARLGENVCQLLLHALRRMAACARANPLLEVRVENRQEELVLAGEI